MRSFDGTHDSYSSDDSRYSTPSALAHQDHLRLELQQLVREITPVLQRLIQAGPDAVNSPDFYRGRDLCLQYRQLQLQLALHSRSSPPPLQRVPDRNVFTNAWLHSQSVGNSLGHSLDHAATMSGPGMEMQHLLAAFSRLTTATT